MATKEQKAFATKYLNEHVNVSVLYLNPRGEFFTEKGYAQNSITVNGKLNGKIEEFTRANGVRMSSAQSDDVDKQPEETDSLDETKDQKPDGEGSADAENIDQQTASTDAEQTEPTKTVKVKK